MLRLFRAVFVSCARLIFKRSSLSPLPHESALSGEPSGQVGLDEEDGVVLSPSLVPATMLHRYSREVQAVSQNSAIREL